MINLFRSLNTRLGFLVRINQKKQKNPDNNDHRKLVEENDPP